MCGRSHVVRESGFGRRRRGGEPFGIDVEGMSPRARVVAALSVLVPVMLSGVFLVVFAPGLWWIFTTYGWISFPALGLLVSGLSDREKAGNVRAPKTGERELLEAMREHGELTPARAAMETSLSVEEADGMLKKLAEEGHLEVRARGGALFYALWGSNPPERRIEGVR